LLLCCFVALLLCLRSGFGLAPRARELPQLRCRLPPAANVADPKGQIMQIIKMLP
jgi:hypothetical protein